MTRKLKKELWPYKITIVSDPGYSLDDIETWLGNNFGAIKGRWNVVYFPHEVDYYFRNDRDTTLFALRWS